MLLAVVDVGGELSIPAWLQALERLGSFALVAFLVWYFVKYALPQQRQDYITANKEQREQHLAAEERLTTLENEAKRIQREHYLQASKDQRTDFLDALKQMQHKSDKLAESVDNLARATYSHVVRAEQVWKKRGEIGEPTT